MGVCTDFPLNSPWHAPIPPPRASRRSAPHVNLIDDTLIPSYLATTSTPGHARRLSAGDDLAPRPRSSAMSRLETVTSPATRIPVPPCVALYTPERAAAPPPDLTPSPITGALHSDVSSLEADTDDERVLTDMFVDMSSEAVGGDPDGFPGCSSTRSSTGTSTPRKTLEAVQPVDSPLEQQLNTVL